MLEIVIAVLYALYQIEVIMLVAAATVFPMFKIYGLHNKNVGYQNDLFPSKGKITILIIITSTGH